MVAIRNRVNNNLKIVCFARHTCLKGVATTRAWGPQDSGMRLGKGFFPSQNSTLSYCRYECTVLFEYASRGEMPALHYAPAHNYLA